MISRRRLRCLVHGGPDLDRQLGDLVADGTLTTEDADAVREFAVYLTSLAATRGREARTETP